MKKTQRNDVEYFIIQLERRILHDTKINEITNDIKRSHVTKHFSVDNISQFDDTNSDRESIIERIDKFRTTIEKNKKIIDLYKTKSELDQTKKKKNRR